ncbi:hypothetical protein KSS87_013006 [Heliosperma pusillum]|nr:hypothetical protein KSS87_013006 [Heliosperma pusillum]
MTPSSKPPSSTNNPNTTNINSNDYYYNAVITKPYSYITLHPRTCLILISILAFHISLLLTLSRHPHPLRAPVAGPQGPQLGGGCELGEFYVYDLPDEFNVGILSNCEELSPWGSRCRALSNDGFGPSATTLDALLPGSIASTWYWTDQFSSEVIFHNRLLHHKCRTVEPENATAYYIPFYAGLSVGKHLWNGSSVKDRDTHCELMLSFIEQLPFFNRSKGWDHFLVMGRITWDFRRSKDEDWGSKCIYMPSMRNITRLLIERNPWDYFDVGVPYPTGFHPNTISDVTAWQYFVRTRERHSLFCFAGATRGLFPNDFRGVLLSQCRDSGGSCRVVDCGGTRCANGTSEILETFLDSEFCLQPRGDSFTRRSIFDCMIAGSIPVFFWRRSAYLQYQWFLPGDPKSYSVFIHRNEVKNGTSIKSVLERYSKEEVKTMREKVVEFIPNLIYAKPNEGLGSMKDAVDIAIDGVLRRIKDKKENGYDW